MALIEYDEYKQRLRDLGPELEKLSAALDMDSARAEARKLEDETAQDGFWNDLERSQKVQQRLKQLQNKIARQDKLVTEWQDLTALCEMGQEAEDEELLEELKSGFQTLEEKIEESRMATLLSGEYDGHSAILTFHAGAGGTEAQDWAQMLYRMYTRWTERHDFTYQILDYEAGFLPLMPTPAGRPALPRWRSCPRSRMTTRWRSGRRTLRCRSTGPAAPAAST